MAPNGAPPSVGMRCPVCGAVLEPGLVSWHRTCPDCRFEASTLTPTINADDGMLAKTGLCDSLVPLRRQNFGKLCDRLEAAAPLDGKQLLEVGCAYGLFLDEVRARGLRGCGIEADAELAARAERRGHRVIRGYFPECLTETGMRDRKFDLIVFNDVFEHLPDVDGAMAACRAHLARRGWLVINLPASTGVLYRTAKLLGRLGWPASFERLWQKDFPSPHLSYFDARNLPQLADKHGFRQRTSFSLNSVSWHGLWQRISADRRVPFWNRAVSFVVLLVLTPLLGLLPQDIQVQVFEAGD